MCFCLLLAVFFWPHDSPLWITLHLFIFYYNNYYYYCYLCYDCIHLRSTAEKRRKKNIIEKTKKMLFLLFLGGHLFRRTLESSNQGVCGLFDELTGFTRKLRGMYVTINLFFHVTFTLLVNYYKVQWLCAELVVKNHEFTSTSQTSFFISVCLMKGGISYIKVGNPNNTK